MAFILSQERDIDDGDGFKRYQEYIEQNKGLFPQSAYRLATSEWYFGFDDHRAPHDAWLESFNIIENSTGERNQNRCVSIEMKLLGAYHDGFVRYFYPKVFSYQLRAWDIQSGHYDFRYDEFRLSSSGNLIHEIEWYYGEESAIWIIEANDVYHQWVPFEMPQIEE